MGYRRTARNFGDSALNRRSSVCVPFQKYDQPPFGGSRIKCNFGDSALNRRSSVCVPFQKYDQPPFGGSRIKCTVTEIHRSMISHNALVRDDQGEVSMDNLCLKYRWSLGLCTLLLVAALTISSRPAT